MYIKKYLFYIIMPSVDRLTSNKEQIETIKNKLIDILGLTPTNNSIVLQLFDKEVEKQQQILAMEDDIKKYFTASNWSYFKNKRSNTAMERPYLNLIRGICKDCNIKYENKPSTMKIGDDTKKIVKYIFYL